jgi:mono/diheme cytochrome c family protein
MHKWMKQAASAVALVLLVSCGEQAPESTLDGIFTADQADRGEGLFTTHCQRCHSIQEFSGRMFAAVWDEVPASALYYRIANTMPMDQPGSLGNAEVTALMAHIFNSNGMPAGSSPLQADLDWMNTIPMRQPGQSE